MKLNLTLFSANPNTLKVLTEEMRTYYSDYLIDNAKPNLVHDQFGQKTTIPKNGGNTINFRRFMPFNKPTYTLAEGIIPDGASLKVTSVSASLIQYGYYVTLSDVLQLESIDNTVVEATKILGNQAGLTLDGATREVLNGGTNVMYAGGVSARASLTADSKLTVDDIYKAARFLKTQNAPKINGSYVAIIHPDVAYDLMRDNEWIDAHKYSASENLFDGEIGKIGGVRFVETSEAKIFKNTPVNAYSTIVLGANAYGVTDVDGDALKTFIKPTGSGGANDPLNQRATVGWKASKCAVRLMESFMVRIESASSFNADPN